jgi:NAD(P)-dependent dehydrogenase (short-subunit alcohol dehydrogenase family)
MHVNAVFGAIASFLCILCGKTGSILEKPDFTGFPADSLRRALESSRIAHENFTMFQKDLLRDKRILITGGGTGLGKASAQRFLELGGEVYICGRRADVLSATEGDLRQLTGGRIHPRACDVRDAAAVEQLMETIWRDGPLHVLMNNAAGNFLAPTEELSLRAFESVIGIVLMGSLHTTLACGRRWLMAQQPAVVLNVTTTYTTTGSAYVVPSAVSKAGVEALTRSLAVEWGNRGIRMNAIAPGPIPTEGAFSRLLPRPELEEFAKKRIPVKRFGTPEEFANLAAFLISDYSGFINGEVVTMDGGEWLQGAGEFTALGRMLTEDEWKRMRPAKKPAK